jgi:cytochrome P450
LAAKGILGMNAFIPETITPPDQTPSNWRYIHALTTNPIALWPKSLFEQPYTILERFGGRLLQVADPDIVKAVLLDHADAFERDPLSQRVLRPLVGDGLLTAEGERWRMQRRSAAPAFRPSALLALVPVMAKAGETMAGRMLARTGTRIPVDVAAEMTRGTLDVIAETLLGAGDPAFSHERISQVISDYIEILGRVDVFDVFGVPEWVPRPWTAKGRRAVRKVQDAAVEALARRRAIGASGTDLLGLLLSARDPETGAGLSDRELRDNIVTFISAGHETTAQALTWTLYLIANDPGVQDRLAAEAAQICGRGPITPEMTERLAYHLMVIREAMRLYPPVAVTQRRALRGFKAGSLEIKAGDIVILLIYVIHRHRRLWEAPECFDPERFAPERAAGRHRFAYLPFGGGPRICIGAKFAELEAVTMLAALVRKLRFLPNPAHRIVPKVRITTRPEGGMPLFVEPR